jgi:2-oxoglutarate ferredoxin oxidoreductase subunit gamma
VKKEIRICGFGGQGIVLSGVILGEAAMLAGHQAVQTQSYGPEARGGAARSEVVIASDEIDYPRVLTPDVTVALSQPGYDRYLGRSGDAEPGAAKNGGLVVVDRDLVEAEGVSALPFTKTAEKVGHRIVTNIVVLGYICSLLDAIPDEALEKAVLANVPKGTEDLNRRAIAAGRALHQQGGSVR